MDDRINDVLDESTIRKLAEQETSHVLEAGQDYVSDGLEPILREAMLLFGMTILKRHMHEILNIQKMYFNQTKEVNDKTISILTSLIKNKDD
jgi:hypothetical protein